MYEYPPHSYFICNRAELSRGLFENTMAVTELPFGFDVYSSRDLPLSSERNDDSTVVLLGLCISIDAPTATHGEICASLSRMDEYAFERQLDRLTGRWVVVRGTGSDLKVYGDATHMLKVCYDKNFNVSSNPRLLCLATDAPYAFSKKYGDNPKAWKSGTIGTQTRIEGIQFLTPNTSISLMSGKLERYYPKVNRTENASLPDLIEQVRATIDPTLPILTRNFKVYVSTTAGLDSRYTLSSLGNRRADFEYFSYSFTDKHVRDAEVAALMCQNLGLKHYTLTPDLGLAPKRNPSTIIFGPEPDPEFEATLKKWCWYNHHRPIATAYHQWMSRKTEGKPPLHLRSNLFEIGRAYWSSRGSTITNVDQLLDASAPQWKGYTEEFSDYAAKTELFSVADYGYEPLDIFYWEHRCATWVSETLQESDFSFNTHSLANCRATLELYLSAPRQMREEGAVFRATIADQANSISTIPFA